MLCPACRADAPSGARFCPSCGQDLLLRGDERRVVTVLFADIVGFTTMSETRDPEQVKNLVDGLFERLVVDIEAFGGRVDKIIGDAIVALFGAPVAHEDDAERAVRAALQMQRSLAEANSALGGDIRLRVGVNTGEVLVGALRSGGDYTAMGDVVNTASRLQSTAEPGQIVVGPATHAATRRVVRYRSLGEIQAKGREASVPAWIAEEALLPPGHRPDRHRAPLVGREAEVGMLRHAIDASLAHGRAALLLVLGEAGVGKSRLVEELADGIDDDHAALVLEGRCVPYGEANVWWPVADALRHGCGIGADDSEERARDLALAAVREALGERATEAEVARVLAGLMHLMGYESPLRGIDQTRAREEATSALITFAERYSADRPVVVALSDLHWADDLVLAMVDTLLERLCDRRFVLLATARRALEERWMPPPGRHNLVSLTLDPLPQNAAAELLRSLAGDDLSDDLANELLDRSGGNPLFLEELVALLTDGGIEQAAHEGVLAGASASVAADLPDTLRGLVAARLDGLSADERRVLDDCSVLGRRGRVSAIEVMAAKHLLMDDVRPALESLAAKELLELRGEAGVETWSFRSDLVREVAYGMLTKADRARSHAGIGKWMEEHEDTEREAVIDRIAHHYGRAAELAAEVGLLDLAPFDLKERALHWIEIAAGRADDTEVPVVAARLYTDALTLVQGEPGERHRAYLLGRARALAALRNPSEARIDADVALQEARTCGDEAGVANAMLVLGDIEQKDNHWDTADALLVDAGQRFAALGDKHREAMAVRLRGFGALFRHEYALATRLLEQAHASFQALGDTRNEAWALQNLAWCAFYAGRPEEAEERLHTAADMFSAIGDEGGLGWALGLLAYTRFMLGHRAEADSMAEEVLGHSSLSGDKWGTGMMYVLQAAVRLWEGHAPESIELATKAKRMFEDIDDTFGLLQAQGVLGRALVSSGRIDEAFGTMDGLRGLSLTGTDGQEQLFHGLALAGSANALGDTDMAAPLLDLTRQTFSGQGPQGELAVAVALHLVQRGEAREARQVLDQTEGLEIDVKGGNATAIAALVDAALGDHEGAITRADLVDRDFRSTYYDRLVAGLARSLVRMRAGDANGAADALEATVSLADGTDDVLAQAIARLAALHVAAAGGSAAADALADGAEERLAALGIGAQGWRRAFDSALRTEAATGAAS